jgi:hypothetical protein
MGMRPFGVTSLDLDRLELKRRSPGRRLPTLMKLSRIPINIATATFTHEKGGGFKWPVSFGLVSAALDDGFLIQEIYTEYATVGIGKEAEGSEIGFIETEDGGSWRKVAAPDTHHYWEAWPVKRNTKWVHYETLLPMFDDEYKNQGGLGTRGILKVNGWLQHFYGLLPTNFCPNTTPAGHLPATTMRPVFWHRTGATHHNLKCRWAPRISTFWLTEGINQPPASSAVHIFGFLTEGRSPAPRVSKARYRDCSASSPIEAARVLVPVPQP